MMRPSILRRGGSRRPIVNAPNRYQPSATSRNDCLHALAITYDSRNDLLDVALDRSNHLIRYPREIVVEEGPAGIASVAVIDADGTRQIEKLKDACDAAARAGMSRIAADVRERHRT